MARIEALLSAPMRLLSSLLSVLTFGTMAILAESARGESRQIDYFVLEGGGPDQGPGPDMDANMAALKRKLGPINPNSSRMYAYGVQQIRILSRSAAVIRDEVNKALDAAEQTGIPIWLHIDPLYAWGADGEASPEEAPPVKFWEHPEMREWIEFPKDGKLPTYIPRLWFNWGPWCSPIPASPAIGAPKFIEFARNQLREGVLDPLKARLAVWKEDSKEYLFAGINIGWETYIPDYDETWLRNMSRNGTVPIKASYPKSVEGLEIDQALTGTQLGYASLYWRGWNEERVVAAAQEEGISRDEKFRQLCYESIHDYMESLSRECAEAGLAPHQIYTHIVALATVQEATTWKPPIWTAVNPYSTPGFTMDNKGGAKYDLEKLKNEIAQAPGSRGGDFGLVETYFSLGKNVYVTDADSYKAEIDELFTNGARVKVIYAAFPFSATRAPEAAFTAVKDWLKEGQP